MKRHTIATLVLYILVTPFAQAKVVYVNKNAPGPTYDGASWATAFTTVQAGVNASVKGVAGMPAISGYQLVKEYTGVSPIDLGTRVQQRQLMVTSKLPAKNPARGQIGLSGSAFIQRQPAMKEGKKEGTKTYNNRAWAEPIGQVTEYRYNVPGVPFDNARDEQSGPSVYGKARQFFLFAKPTGEISVIWQDRKSKVVRLTSLTTDPVSAITIPLPNDGVDGQLACAARDPRGNVYYVLVEAGERTTKKSSLDAVLIKTNESGRPIVKRRLDTTEADLNMANFGKDDIGSLIYSSDSLFFIISRGMYNGHQASTVRIFDSGSLETTKDWGQGSSHSFDNYVVAASTGGFLAMELADNYPRGVHVHYYDASFHTSSVVYTFKTRHATTPGTAGTIMSLPYKTISDEKTTYYQWSNDNATYTELGGIVETDGGTAVFVCTERSPEGKTLDGRRTASPLSDPRNIAFVKTDNQLRPLGEISETGGFYDFGGGWQAQENRKITWLTEYTERSHENATRLKAVRLGDETILLLWEKWTPMKYVSTHAIRLSPDGKVVQPEFEMTKGVRLNRRDDVLVLGNSIYMVSGAPDGKLLLHVIRCAAVSNNARPPVSTHIKINGS